MTMSGHLFRYFRKKTGFEDVRGHQFRYLLKMYE